jgi:hypothetical protein
LTSNIQHFLQKKKAGFGATNTSAFGQARPSAFGSAQPSAFGAGKFTLFLKFPRILIDIILSIAQPATSTGFGGGFGSSKCPLIM